jgi:hypothetical protein
VKAQRGQSDYPLCSRNARPQNDAKEQADRSSCSQNLRDKKDGKDTLRREPILQGRFLAGDLLQRVFPARLIELFEPIEAVQALAGCGKTMLARQDFDGWHVWNKYGLSRPF